MTKKQILEQWFTDVNNDLSYYYFNIDGKPFQISAYTLGNLITNTSHEALKNEILNRVENQPKYYLKHSELKPTLRVFKIQETKFNDGTPTKSIQYFSWDFEKYRGVTDKETRDFLSDPEKLKIYADPITKEVANQIIKDVLHSDKLQDL